MVEYVNMRKCRGKVHEYIYKLSGEEEHRVCIIFDLFQIVMISQAIFA